MTPLVQLDHRHWVQELFHGPTLAFKDVAMQFLSRLMDRILAARSARATIVSSHRDAGSHFSDGIAPMLPP